MDEEEETEARAIEKAQFRPYLFLLTFTYQWGPVENYVLSVSA